MRSSNLPHQGKHGRPAVDETRGPVLIVLDHVEIIGERHNADPGRLGPRWRNSHMRSHRCQHRRVWPSILDTHEFRRTNTYSTLKASRSGIVHDDGVLDLGQGGSDCLSKPLRGAAPVSRDQAHFEDRHMKHGRLHCLRRSRFLAKRHLRYGAATCWTRSVASELCTSWLDVKPGRARSGGGA